MTARALLAIALLTTVARGAGVAVEVYFDSNGNGQRDRGEAGAPQVLISDGDRCYRTDTDGRVRFELLRPGGEPARVFVVVPGGHRAATPWHALVEPGEPTDRACQFGLQPVTEPPETRFAVTGDPQVTATDAAEVGARLLAELAPNGQAPHFVAVLGDLTATGQPTDLAAWSAAVASARVPVHSVFGGQDGAASPWAGCGPFEAAVGPAWYAFWSGGRCHLVLVTEPEVLTGLQQARQMRWLRRLLALLPDQAELVVLAHVPPAGSELELLRARHRLRAVVYAHWHENAVSWAGDTPLLCTGPYRGSDWGAGTGSFRRLRFGAAGLDAAVVTSGVRRLLTVLSPSTLDPPDRLAMPLRVAAYDSRDEVTAVEALLDDRPALLLRRAGRFTWRLDLPATGARRLTVRARARSGDVWETSVEVPPPAPRVTPAPAPQPPLVRAWLTPTGSPRVTNALPTAAGPRVIVACPSDDLPASHALRAVDATTGQVLWQAPTAGPVRGEPRVVDGRVVTLSANLVVQAWDAATGRAAWQRELGGQAVDRHRNAQTGLGLWRDRVLALLPGGQIAALTWADGVVAGELPAPGAWRGAPAATAQQLVVATRDGLLGLDPATGEVRWRTRDLALPQHGPLVIDNGTGYVVGRELAAVDLATGAVRWRRPCPAGGLNRGAVAVADGVVYAPGSRPTAWYAATGAPVWPDAAPLDEPAPGTPLVLGELLWTITDGGDLVAWRRDSGREVWRAAVGLPLKAGPVLVGSTLVAIDADGNLHGFQAAPR